MGCQRLRKCCCCGSLQTGALVTGVLGILLSAVTIVFIWLFPQRYTLSWDKDDLEEKENTNWMGISNTAMKIILTVNLVMTMLISTAMMIGAVKRRSWFMLPWVVLGVVLSIGLLVSVLHTSIKLFLVDDDEKKWDYNVSATIILVGGLVYLVVFAYLWAVVFSHYLNVKDEEDRGRYMKPPYKR